MLREETSTLILSRASSRQIVDETMCDEDAKSVRDLLSKLKDSPIVRESRGRKSNIHPLETQGRNLFLKTSEYSKKKQEITDFFIRPVVVRKPSKENKKLHTLGDYETNQDYFKNTMTGDSGRISSDIILLTEGNDYKSKRSMMNIGRKSSINITPPPLINFTQNDSNPTHLYDRNNPPPYSKENVASNLMLLDPFAKLSGKVDWNGNLAQPYLPFRRTPSVVRLSPIRSVNTNFNENLDKFSAISKNERPYDFGGRLKSSLNIDQGLNTHKQHHTRTGSTINLKPQKIVKIRQLSVAGGAGTNNVNIEYIKRDVRF